MPTSGSQTPASGSEPFPPKPEEPMPGECCGRGCVNCVWVYYERALQRWNERCDAIRRGETLPTTAADQLTPLEDR